MKSPRAKISDSVLHSRAIPLYPIHSELPPLIRSGSHARRPAAMRLLPYAPSPRPPQRSLATRRTKPGPPCALPFPDALRAAAAATAAAMSISLSLLTGDAVGAERPRGPELCRDGAAAETKEEVRRSEVVTNEQLVEEAWEVVNEGFLPDAGSRPWSPEMWMVST